VLLLERLLAPENETLLRKQEKQLLEVESVKLHQEKVLEEQPEEKVLEEKPQGDLQEDEDGRIFYSFFIYIWYELLVGLKVIYLPNGYLSHK